MRFGRPRSVALCVLLLRRRLLMLLLRPALSRNVQAQLHFCDPRPSWRLRGKRGGGPEVA